MSHLLVVELRSDQHRENRREILDRASARQRHIHHSREEEQQRSKTHQPAHDQPEFIIPPKRYTVMFDVSCREDERDNRSKEDQFVNGNMRMHFRDDINNRKTKHRSDH